ncbi:MAG TPA: lytic murein transglycosylase [Gammaproteobacteria bacterium]|nr:lytic murein transglycosylase [Gammaproteobacteria bacterium]
MKENLLLLTFSVLLLASSSISSQTAGEPDVEPLPTSPGFDNPDATTENTGELILAKINTDTRMDDIITAPVIEKSNRQTDPIVLPDTDSHETDATKNDVPLSTSPTDTFTDEEMAELRQRFLQAESALKNKDDAKYFLLADKLKKYPLYPYLQYQWLKKHLSYERQIKYFLTQHGSSRYAHKLKRKWLYHLARHRQWPLFLQFYTPTKETELNCYYRTAQFDAGDEQEALEGARDLWAVGYSQPHECDPLFEQLKKSSLFTRQLLWQRFDAALQNNKSSLATYIIKLLPRDQHAIARLWLNLHRNPSRYMSQFLRHPMTAQSPLMFRQAIDRLASKDIMKAVKIWDANKQSFTIDEKLAKKLEKRLALKLVFERESGAYERLGQLDEQDNSSRTWRVRIALAEQNWPNVLSAIHALNEEEKVREKWQYWLARAYMETGEIAMAQALLTELSTKRSYYGFLAADKVNSIYQLSDNPVNVSPEEIAGLKNRKAFRVAFELMVLDRKNEAKLQWWHALRPLNKKEIIVAAKLAQQWQWDEIAIFTIAKAQYWDDLEVRFPLSYADNVHKNSAQQKLNPAILFGLIRRESAFNEKAHSPVGARGLMQIMPQTGRQIARHFNERWHGNKSLYNPAKNLKYGSYYYQKLLNQFGGHYALALAAYNAGPERVKKWLPETEALPADIWIETIPFHETREYVTTVLAYALIYQQRIQSDKLSMIDFTRDIQPLTPAP